MNQSLAQLRTEPHTSVSAIKSYLSCPRKYFFHYIEREPPMWRPLALAFGQAWHAAIGHHLLHSTHERHVPVDELRSLLRDELTAAFHAEGPPVLLEVDDQNEGAVIDKAIAMLDVFLERVPLPEQVVGVEVSFALDVVSTATGEVLRVPLVGAIDAIIVEGGSLTLWEVKTAKKKWSRAQADLDLQPTAYRIAARDLGHGDAGVTLLVTTKTSRPDVQVERLTRHGQDEREFVEVALGVHKAIDAGIDYPKRDWPCALCSFADRCGT